MGTLFLVSMTSRLQASLVHRLPWLIAVLAVALFAVTIARFFPNAQGRLGYDYSLFLPWFIGGYFWQSANGALSPPEFLPSFCGGVPFLFNPQSVAWSLPQALMLVMPPLASLVTAWVAFGLAGALGMYALLRRVFACSGSAALLGAVLFLLNGFYTTRMIIGHVTYHGVMLLPLIALLILTAPPATDRPWQCRATWSARAAACALLLAYQFYSGGTNTILPMLLALLMLALLIAWLGRWHRAIVPMSAAVLVLWVALSAYKLLPALAYASHVVRPVSLRMTDSLASLVGAAGLSLFAPQALAFIPRETLVLDRVEFEYGVGMVPLLLILAGLRTATRRGQLRPALAGSRAWLAAALLVLATVPILVNWDGPGLRWLMLHLPVIKMMSVMVRFWFVYIPLLCVVAALLVDYLLPRSKPRSLWVGTGLALTLAQAGATDLRWYEWQGYDPAPLLSAYKRVAQGAPVPAITRIADPWRGDTPPGRRPPARNNALAQGVSALPCDEPMFGYRMEALPAGRISSGAVLEERAGLLNLRNPACYVFPAENQCHPGAEFTANQRAQARAFAQYRPFPYAAPASQRMATWLSLATLLACLLALALSAPALIFDRRAR